MKKAIAVTPILLLCGSLLFAAQPAPHFSGQDYLSLSHDQRADAISSFIEKSKQRGITGDKGDGPFGATPPD